jgi:23S rRNA pseudouridine2605 synthase
LFPFPPIVCYQGFMREHEGKGRPRRDRAEASPLGARPRQHRSKKPPSPAGGKSGVAAPKKRYLGPKTTSSGFDLSLKPAPRNGGGRKPNPSQVARLEAGEDGGERIAKVIARAGLCSRREAEGWIGEGRVALDGVPLTNPAINVRASDKITIDGEPLVPRARTRLFLFHKPRGLVTTERDPEGRPAVFDFLRKHWPDGPRVVSIGRLDINTEGLLLLTNDGGLARVLELPSTGWVRRYRVRVNGSANQAVLDGLREGLTLDGVRYAGIEAALDRVQGANSWLTVALREGKNREIKRVLEHLGLQVNRLIRLSFGPFQLGDIAEGAVEEVRTRVLRDQLGPTLAGEAGADFLSPLENEKDVAEMPEVVKPREPRTSGGPDRTKPQRRTGSSRVAIPPARDRHLHVEAKVEAKVKPAPRPRKHISAIRIEESETRGPRKRVERRETADRAGRTVYVEQLKLAGGGKESREKTPAKRPGKGKPFAGRGGGFGEERGARPGRPGPKPHDDPRAKGPKGKTERGRGGAGHPTPRGQKPQRPRGKS